MKFASLKDGSRDGRLALVSRDLTRALPVPFCPTLQAALDRWREMEPKLQELANGLEEGTAEETIPFHPKDCMAPLPRAYQWADASAYVNHVELVRKARGATLPESFWHDPLMYQGGSDGFLAPHDPIPFVEADWGLDFEAEIAVILGDVPRGCSAEAASVHIKLLALVNDVSLRGLIPGELAKGFGFFQSKPASAFAPLAVTPDEAGAAWDGKKVSLPVSSWLNGALFGKPEAGEQMTFDFPRLVAHAARTRSLAAGTILGSGTISNKEGDSPGRPVADGGRGYSCLAELRMIETLREGAPKTPFLAPGDRIKIEVMGNNGVSLFGAIEQEVRTDNG